MKAKVEEQMKTAIMSAPKPVMAAAVSRVSLAIQANNYSIASQHVRIAELSAKHGVTVPDEYLLDDDGYSGVSFNRPAFRRALQLVQEGRVSAIVFPYVDRFSRNVEGGLAMIRQLREAGARVFLGEIGEVTNETHVKLMLFTLLGIAEAQRDSIIAKSMAGTRQKIAQGLPQTTRALYGYHFVTKRELDLEAMHAGRELPTGKPKNRFTIDERAMKNLKLMARLALEGETAPGIAREMMARGIAAPLGGKIWSPTGVRRVLNNESYSSGLWYYGRKFFKPITDSERRGKKRNLSPDHVTKRCITRPRSEWQSLPLPGGPVWTKAEHTQITEALRRNGEVKVGKPAAVDGREAMLKSMCVCAKCGMAVIAQHRTRPSGQRRCWYLCSYRDRAHGHHVCETGGRRIKADVLESNIWRAWVNAFTVELPTLVAEYFDEAKREAGDATADALKAQRAKLVKNRQGYMNKEVEADTEEDRLHYAERATTLKAELAILDRRIAAVEKATPSINVADVQRRAMLIAKTSDPRVKREALLSTVEKITWAGDEADMYLRVAVQASAGNLPGAGGGRGANQKPHEREIADYIPLKVHVKIAA